MASVCHALECLLNSWQWVRILFYACIQPAKVHAEAEGPILFVHQHHCITPWGLVGMDSPCLQHVSQGCSHLLQQGRWYLPELFLKELTVCDANLMLIALMQPSSLPKVKTSWKVRTSSLATAAFPGVQELRPSRFNFSRSFSCHAATKRGSSFISSPRAACTSRDNSAGGTGNADSTHAILVPFFK